jgi:hypothetical protein
MSVSYDYGDGANGTCEVGERVAHGLPPEEARNLRLVCLGARVAQCPRVNDTQTTQEVLRVIRIGDVLADAHACALAVLIFVNELG